MELEEEKCSREEIAREDKYCSGRKLRMQTQILKEIQR
jgi:hypothetical protein